MWNIEYYEQVVIKKSSSMLYYCIGISRDLLFLNVICGRFLLYYMHAYSCVLADMSLLCLNLLSQCSKKKKTFLDVYSNKCLYELCSNGKLIRCYSNINFNHPSKKNYKIYGIILLGGLLSCREHMYRVTMLWKWYFSGHMMYYYAMVYWEKYVWIVTKWMNGND